MLTDVAKFPNELSEFHETEMLVKINAMAVIYHNIFGNLDQKIFKSLLDCNVKVSQIYIILLANCILIFNSSTAV